MIVKRQIKTHKQPVMASTGHTIQLHHQLNNPLQQLLMHCRVIADDALFRKLVHPDVSELVTILQCEEKEAFEIVSNMRHMRDARLFARMVVAACVPVRDMHKDPDNLAKTLLHFELCKACACPCIMFHINIPFLRGKFLGAKAHAWNTSKIHFQLRRMNLRAPTHAILHMFSLYFAQAIDQVKKNGELWGDFRLCCQVAITQRNRFLRARSQHPPRLSEFIRDGT